MASRQANWALNIFKGRIGEAIVESVLIEFGYRVQRAGFEQIDTDGERLRPDLVVTHPRNPNQLWLVEVKYRAARPTSVQLEPKRVAALSRRYPKTIFAFTSAYDGGIYCATVKDLLRFEGRAINLLDPVWKPLGFFFEQVRAGDRMKEFWSGMQTTMHNYGARIVSGRTEQVLWEGEYAALARFLEESWEERLEQFGIADADVERLTLEERWDRVREIVAAHAAMDLIGDDEILTATAQSVLYRAQGKSGEKHLLFDLEELAKCLRIGLDDAHRMAMLISKAIKSRADPAVNVLVDRIISQLPDGLGQVTLVDSAQRVEDAVVVDLKTALRFASNPSRLDR